MVVGFRRLTLRCETRLRGPSLGLIDFRTLLHRFFHIFRPLPLCGFVPSRLICPLLLLDLVPTSGHSSRRVPVRGPSLVVRSRSGELWRTSHFEPVLHSVWSPLTSLNVADPILAELAIPCLFNRPVDPDLREGSFRYRW